MSTQQQFNRSTAEIYKKISKSVPEIEWKIHAPLIEKINKKCPHCHTPGFDIMNTNEGLPCALCSLPTRSILSCTYQCKVCDHNEEHYFPRGKKTEEPTYCDHCIP